MPLRRFAPAALLFAALAVAGQMPGAAALAGERWQAVPVEKPTLPAGIVAQTLAPAPSGIPGMLTATGPEAGGIVRAWYAQPTGRYRHGVLGDKTEAGALVAERADGRRFTHRLGELEVFEDLYPRIADLDGDGESEVVAIRSSIMKGASVTIYGLNGDALVEKARTPFLGRPFRWLNIAGIGRFSGAATPEIAFVATPHIGGKLAFLSYQRGRLTLIAAQEGFSNHVAGSTELRLSAMADIDGDGRADLALPSADRRRLLVMSLAGGRLTELARADLPAAIDKAIAVSGSGRDTVFTVGLENGGVHAISRQR